MISRRHAQITFRNEEYHLEDLGSTNGTYVNGIKIVKCILRNNDQIDIGGVKMLFTEEKSLQKI
jgi:pSer/pThr/pTyr-binding forkhead associated (FHA) protein